VTDTVESIGESEPTNGRGAASVAGGEKPIPAEENAVTGLPEPTAAADVSGRDLSLQLSEVERRILTAFEEKLAFDTVKEKQLDRLHDELQRYRSDLVTKAIRPVFQSVIRLHDDLGKVLDALAREEPSQVTPERLLKLLRSFHDDVELALNNNGVSSVRTETEIFDPRRQRVLRTVETTDASQVGKLAGRLRPGFEYEGNLIEKERVAVYAMPSTKTVFKA